MFQTLNRISFPEMIAKIQQTQDEGEELNKFLKNHLQIDSTDDGSIALVLHNQDSRITLTSDVISFSVGIPGSADYVELKLSDSIVANFGGRTLDLQDALKLVDAILQERI